MDRNDELKYIITKKYKLTDNSLLRKIEEINNVTGISSVCYETEDGYIFKDERFQIPIGELTFNKIIGEYNRFQLYSGAVDEVRERTELERQEMQRARAEARKAARKKRKFKLQVGKAIATGLAITIAGTAALIGMGVIDSPFKPHEPSTGIEVSAESSLNYYDTANDILIVEWLNYAMGQVQDICNSSEYEMFSSLSQEVYSSYFAPAMSAYYTYLDYKDADLPLSSEYGDTDLVAKAHDNFRARANEFTYYLSKNVYFENIVFGKTPLANAVVTDTNGNQLQESKKIKGELVDNEGRTVTAVDGDAKVNVRLTDIKNSPYTLDNLPDDVTIINGEVYVGSKHMYNSYGSITK